MKYPLEEAFVDIVKSFFLCVGVQFLGDGERPNKPQELG